jgi:hypothetical protein
MKSFMISKSVLMNNNCLFMYADYILNKCYQFKKTNVNAPVNANTGAKAVPKTIAMFCSVYCDDCNGSCMNAMKPVNRYSMMCNDNANNNCICL